MSEEKIETVDEADIILVMTHTQTTREIAIYFLEKNPNDLIGAILDIQEDQESVEIKEPDCT